MKQLKAQFVRFQRSPWFPLAVSGVILFAFCVCCTRLFLKTDDGNFTGMLLEPGFTLKGFLTERYLTCSGRTVGEGLLMLFLRAPTLLWKCSNAAALLSIAYYLCRLFSRIKSTVPLRERFLFASASLWMIFFLSLNSPAFWFSASFFYAWPMAAMLCTLSPLVTLLMGGTVRYGYLPLWCLSAVLAASQEQSCALTLTFFVILFIALCVKEKRFRPIFLPQLLLIAAEAVWMLASPGMAVRSAGEAAASYPAFTSLSLLQKLYGGFVNLIGHQLFFVQLISILLLAFLSISLYRLRKKKWLAILLGVINGINAFLCIPFNIYMAATRGGFQWLNTAFSGGRMDWAAVLAVCLGALVILACALLATVLLAIKRDAVCTGVFLCVMAAYASAMAMSVSPTIYASGQRVFFSTDILLLAACGLLYCSLPQTKAVRRLRMGAYVYAGVNFSLDVILFTLLELPWLG